MTPRCIFQVPAPKKCAESYRGAKPRGEGARGLYRFCFSCVSLFPKKKIKILKIFGYNSYTVILFRLSFLYGYSGFRDNLLFYPRPGLFLKRLSAKKFFEKFFYIRVEKWGVFWYIQYVTDNTDTGHLSKSYIRYATGFAPKERMAYAIDNGKYGRIKISVNSDGDQRIIIGSLRLSGKNLYIIESVVNAVLYRKDIQEMMEFEEFCNANNNIPKRILKIPARPV